MHAALIGAWLLDQRCATQVMQNAAPLRCQDPPGSMLLARPRNFDGPESKTSNMLCLLLKALPAVQQLRLLMLQVGFCSCMSHIVSH
jgi:hypothetical protein